MNNELRNVATREAKSVLRKKDYEAMSSLDLEKVLEELKTMCPVTFTILTEMLEISFDREKKIAPLCLLYGIIMFKRCKDLSCLQRINTLLLANSDANTEVRIRNIPP